MIKPKYGHCIDCGPGSPERYLTAGRCQTHYWQNRTVINAAKRKERQVRTGLPINSDVLGLWFDFHNEQSRWICENCGLRLQPFSPQVRSSCQAHIVPKEHFKSVRGCLDNHLLLGGLHQACHCHADYDANWEKAEGMSVFTIATERFIKFKHLILPSEYKYLPGVFHALI